MNKILSILLTLYLSTVYSQTVLSHYKMEMNDPLLNFAQVVVDGTKISVSNGKINHVVFIGQSSVPSVKVIEAELCIDIVTKIVYSLKDSTFYEYKNPERLPENPKILSKNEYEYRLSHQSDTTTIIFDKSLPKTVTGELLFENNEHGIRKISGSKYTVTLISSKKIPKDQLEQQLEHAKKVCLKKSPPKNLLFGY